MLHKHLNEKNVRGELLCPLTKVRASPSLSPRIRLMLIDWPNSVVSNFRSLCKAHILWPAAKEAKSTQYPELIETTILTSKK